MNAFRITAIAAAAATIVGCGENIFGDTTAVSDPDTFEAVAFEFENEAGQTFDLIDAGGRFVIMLDENTGEFTSDFSFGSESFRVTGTFVETGNEFIFSDDPFEDDAETVERVFEFERAGDVLFLADSGAVWDVDEDGFAEAADLNIRLELL